MNRISAAAFGLLAVGCARHVAPAGPPPDSVAQAVCLPTFRLPDRRLEAGTAFLVETAAPSPRRLLVSSLEPFGPSADLDAQIPAADLPAKVQGVRCKSIAGPAVFSGGHALLIADARPRSSSYLKDVSAFPPEGDLHGVQPLKLAQSAPRVGDPVWLAAEVMTGAATGQRLHRAVVTYADEDSMEYDFDNAGVNMRATGGAPVVNAKGEVVGLSLGGEIINAKMKGEADSLVSLRDALASAK